MIELFFYLVTILFYLVNVWHWIVCKSPTLKIRDSCFKSCSSYCLVDLLPFQINGSKFLSIPSTNCLYSQSPLSWGEVCLFSPSSWKWLMSGSPKIFMLPNSTVTSLPWFQLFSSIWYSVIYFLFRHFLLLGSQT